VQAVPVLFDISSIAIRYWGDANWFPIQTNVRDLLRLIGTNTDGFERPGYNYTAGHFHALKLFYTGVTCSMSGTIKIIKLVRVESLSGQLCSRSTRTSSLINLGCQRVQAVTGK